VAPSITLETMVARTENLMSTALDDDTVMMNIESGAYYGLDGTGQAIWSMLETPQRVAAVCEALLQEYDVDAETCRRQVHSFVERLHAEGLVQIVDQTLA
jgi:GTP cyclohydrolase I